MGWFYGFKPHPVCNNRRELLPFCLTAGNVDDRDPTTVKTLTGKLFGKIPGDRGSVSQPLFEMLFNDAIHPATGIRCNMRNRLMPLFDHILLTKRPVIEIVNDGLKNICDIEHSRHRAVPNFIINLVTALGGILLFRQETLHSSGF
jgi:hypothetical protein